MYELLIQCPGKYFHCFLRIKFTVVDFGEQFIVIKLIRNVSSLFREPECSQKIVNRVYLDLAKSKNHPYNLCL